MNAIVEDQSSASSVDEFTREVAWLDEAELSDDILQKVYIKHFDGRSFWLCHKVSGNDASIAGN